MQQCLKFILSKELMTLEYKINKGELKDFEKDIKTYHLKRIQAKSGPSIKSADELKESLMEKYNLDEGEFANNYYAHFDKICSAYNKNWREDGS